MLVKDDLRRIFTGYRPYLAYAVSLLMLLRPVVEELRIGAEYSFLQMQLLPFGFSDYTPFAAIFCVLPFADSFCEDYNSGYIREITLRIGPKKYAIQRFLSNALGGGLTTAATIASTFLVCRITATIPDTAETALAMSGTLWEELGLLLPYDGMGFCAARVLFAFLFGCLWASVGLCVSTFVVNRYATLVFPFVIYQMLWRLVDSNILNPAYMLAGDSSPSILTHILYQFILITVCGAITIFRMKRKVLV